LSKDIPRTSELDALLKPVTTAYQKMVIIHDYVRKNMQWNNYDNIWALEGVKGAWRDKKGTSGEINLILINLLKDAGLKVKPILVSTRDNRVINTSIAGFDQFNKVLAYVEIGDKVYVLDATEKETPSNLIPFEVMASEGLLIEKISTYEWGWSVLWDENHKRKKDVFINAEIDDKGMLKGNATVAAYDYAKMELVSLAKEGNAKIVEQLKAQADIKIDSFVLTGIASDTLPMVETFEFSTPVSTSNEYHYFSGNFFAGLEKNPFIADERATDIFFGVRQSFSINNHIFLPDGYQMDELPANLKMITPDTSVSFSRMASYADGAVSINYQLEYRDPVYPVGNYPDFKEFYKKMFGLLNEKFVYKKK